VSFKRSTSNNGTNVIIIIIITTIIGKKKKKKRKEIRQHRYHNFRRHLQNTFDSSIRILADHHEDTTVQVISDLRSRQGRGSQRSFAERFGKSEDDVKHDSEFESPRAFVDVAKIVGDKNH